MINDFTIRTVISSLLGLHHVPEDMIARHRRFGSIQSLRLHLMRQPRFQKRYARLQDRALHSPLDITRNVTVFQHIPKCGGASLHNLLEAQLGPAFAERHNGLGNWPALDLAEASYFSGHYDTPSLALIPQANLRIVTILREPEARLLSLYRFLRAISPEAGPAQNRNMALVRLARAHTPEAFFSHPDLATHPSIHNAMTRQLAEPLKQKSWESFYPKATETGLVDRDPKQALALAMAHLDGMAGVALLEELPRSLPPLLDALGLDSSLSLPHENSTERNIEDGRWFEPVPKVEMTKALQKALALHIEVDRKLYYDTAERLSQRGIL